MGKSKILKVKCEGTQYIDFHKLNEFQEDIKTISKENLEALKNSLKQGIKAPQFVWKYNNKWWILDGHQRKIAFQALEDEGWTIPLVPVVEIFAKTKKEAKANVLLYVSQHGEVNRGKIEVYIQKYNIELKNIVISTNPLKIELPNFKPDGFNETNRLDILEPKIIQCPYCKKEFDEREM